MPGVTHWPRVFLSPLFRPPRAPETLILVPDAHATWGAVRDQIAHLRPQYVCKRVLYSGNELADADRGKTLGELRVVKESTLQFFCSLKAADEDDDEDEVNGAPPPYVECSEGERVGITSLSVVSDIPFSDR